MSKKIKKIILNIFFNITSKLYKKIFIRKNFYFLNKFLYKLSLNGIGVLNYQNNKISGEEHFLNKFLLKNKGQKIIFDIGANIGNYSKMIKQISLNTKLYSFEPHPKTFLTLKGVASKNNFLAFNFGFGNKEEQTKIYDYADNDGSSHASLYSKVITDIHKGKATEHEITITKIDTFVKKYKINKIDLLKIDTEGNELDILKGAKDALKNNLIDVIQFEFTQLNTISRVFLKDFYDLLKNFTFYRMLPDGILPLGEYNPVFCEIFAYQNIIAIKDGVNIKL